jgi:signal transduction histidine kinase
VDANPVIVQAAVSIPITLGLVIYTLLRRERSTLHLLLAGTLFSAVVWLAGMVLRLVVEAPGLRLLGQDFEFLSVVLMPPLFVVTMGHLARSPHFERSHAATISLFAIFALFVVAYLTNDAHHLFLRDREAALAGAHPALWAGPLYWGSQILSALCNTAALGFAVLTLVRGRTPDERKRMAMVLAAAVVPILAHWVYVFELLPLDYSLAPGTLGVSAAFFVQGVHRYGLLGVQPIVHHDLIEQIDDGLLLADCEGLVLDANASAEATLGAERTALRGLHLSEVLARVTDDGDATALGRRIASLPLDGGRLSGEIRTRGGGSIEVSAGAVAARGSQAAGRFVSLRDRSDQRRSERLLRERQKLESVGILAAGVAHEVNNPLAYVRANLVHLRGLAARIDKRIEISPDDPDAELLEFPEILDESLGGLDRIGRIVESMLRFSRVPDDGIHPVDLNDVVGQALRLAELHRVDHVRVDCELTPRLPRVMGSPDRLVQVLLNLFLNAKQALADRSEGHIVATTSVEDGAVLVRVRDDGPGIPSEQRERVFDPFFTTRPPDQGTGLGLSIAFDIVREHGGTLELSSSPKHGACFEIRLPGARA